ncbi:uncharacterized protein [Rhodnius prolixus]|uniref:uncharacterized protein n=1 Tax=Rhodnius prolixus TaxID=13249 RepID=UPI003D18BEB9
MEFCFRDQTAIKVKLHVDKEAREIVVASTYLPYDSTVPPPSEEMQYLTNRCRERGLQLLIGCDANSHNEVWGSSGTNQRGKYLLDFISANNLHVINEGEEPTFHNSIRREVIDLTLGTNFVSTLVRNWHVSGVPSLSDHMYIRFDIGFDCKEVVTYRNPRRTDWDSFRRDLSANIGTVNNNFRTRMDIDEAAERLQGVIKEAFWENCAETVITSNRKVGWWNNQLKELRSKVRKLFNVAKRRGTWKEYREALTSYNIAIRKAKRDA